MHLSVHFFHEQLKTILVKTNVILSVHIKDSDNMVRVFRACLQGPYRSLRFCCLVSGFRVRSKKQHRKHWPMEFVRARVLGAVFSNVASISAILVNVKKERIMELIRYMNKQIPKS